MNTDQPQPAPFPQAQPQPRPRGYLGRPDNKKNPNAIQLPRPPRPPGKGKGTPEPPPRSLPQPQHLQAAGSSSQVKNESLRESAFTTDFGTKEDNPHLSFTPSLSNLPLVAHYTYLHYITEDVRIQRKMTPEYFQYYVTALAWIHITNIKRSRNKELTQAEVELLRVTDNLVLSIPDPIHIYLSQYGLVQPPTGVHLEPDFPPLPTTRIGNVVSGFFGPINTDTHNLYEEIPCMGVCAEAVCQAVGDHLPGRYVSILETEQVVPTWNLLGYHRLSSRHQEAKSIANNFGIFPNEFPETITNTGLNIPFIEYVSSYVSERTSFKLHRGTVQSLGTSGHTTQLVNCVPTPGLINLPHQASHVEVIPRTMFRESILHTGIGLYISAQRWKSSEEGDELSWTCATDPDGDVPEQWRLNANARRNNTPQEFRVNRFSGTAYSSDDYVRQVVDRLSARV